MPVPPLTAAPPTHPTILVGYGPYGLRVLRRFLLDAENHGLLTWEDPPEATSPDLRRLRDLILIHVAGPSGDDESESYLAKDLYRQITRVDPDEKDFKKTILEAKRQLLDEAARSADPSRLRLGLDVFVLAQPTTLETLGTLERILPPAMYELAGDAGLRQTAHSDARISFILVFDFDNYWDRSPAGKIVRAEVGNSIKRWEKNETASFARIYILDGHTAGGNRTEALRVEELVLLLEFLLFAGMRDDPGLRRLYQREDGTTLPLGTFGIRLIEQSQGLLKRLVAAHFALGWLGYIGGNETKSDVRERLRASLASFRPPNPDVSGIRVNLQERLEAGIEQMERELAQLRPVDEDWPARFREELAVATMRLKGDLANWAGEQTQHLIDTTLKNVSRDMEEAVTSALHHDSAPAPLGVVIQELKDLQPLLQAGAASGREPEPPEPSEDPDLAAIDQIHREFRMFKQSQLNPSRLSDWWILLAVVVAAAWTPIALEAIEEIPSPPVDASFLLASLYSFLSWMSKPVIVAPLLLLAVAAAGRYGFHKGIQARIERGLLTFTHPDRGWIIDRIRRVLRSGRMRASLEAYGEYVFGNLVRRLRGVVLREAHRELERLGLRRKEMEWLKSELRTYLVSYGLDPDKPVEGWARIRSRPHGYRYSADSLEDFRRLLRINPPTKDRYESTQARFKPFPDWSELYSREFLYPVVFLERLSREYEEGNAGSAGTPAALTEFLSALEQGFSCAMAWETGEGPDVVESYCVLPGKWKALPDVERHLINQRLNRQHILEGSDQFRAYIVRFQLGVSSDKLQDSKVS